MLSMFSLAALLCQAWFANIAVVNYFAEYAYLRVVKTGGWELLGQLRLSFVKFSHCSHFLYFWFFRYVFTPHIMVEMLNNAAICPSVSLFVCLYWPVASSKSARGGTRLKRRLNKWLCYGRGTARRAVSRKFATTKHPIWKLEFQVYRVALFVWSYV